jgi:Porin subfamily
MVAVKRVLLGSAAGVFVVAGAQAADLAVKAKPVEYVKVCSLYGAGFWYVPGTDTCIKIGAFVKLQVEYNMASTGPFMLGMAAGGNGGTDTGGRNTRTDTSPFTIAGRFFGGSMDMRTQTEYGTLRSYFDWVISAAGSTDAWASGSAQQSSQTPLNTRAFIQFAGFTAGRMRSFFDMYFQGTYAFAGQRFGADTSPNGIMGAAYTWQFGGGLSASASLEDNSGAANGRGRVIVNSALNPLSIGNAIVADDKGNQFFDPVVNVRLDQAWGFVGVSAALHDASAGYYGSTEGTGHPGDKFGYAVTPAFLINNPFGLQGDAIAGQAVWSKGAVGYAIPGSMSGAFFGSGTNLAMGFVMDGIYNGTTGPANIDLTTVWSFNAAYEHRWNPQWRTSIYGGMFGVQFDDEAKTAVCNSLATSPTALGQINFKTNSCSPNWSMSEVGSRTLWNPVPDLDVGFDVVWYHLNTAFNGATTNVIGPFGAKPAGVYTISNQDSLAGVFRIQRNFLY